MDQIQNLQVNSIDDFDNQENSKIKIFKSYNESNVLVNILLPTVVLKCNYEIFGTNDYYKNGIITNNYGTDHIISFIAVHNDTYFIKLKLTEQNIDSDNKETLVHSMYYGNYNSENKKKRIKINRNISMAIEKEVQEESAEENEPENTKINMYGVVLSSEEDSDDELDEVVEVVDETIHTNSASNMADIYRLSNNSDILNSMYPETANLGKLIDSIGGNSDSSEVDSESEVEENSEENNVAENEENSEENEENSEESYSGETNEDDAEVEEADANLLLLELLNSNINSIESEVVDIYDKQW